jgi:uncharacterized protein (TIGR02996 family)
MIRPAVAGSVWLGQYLLEALTDPDEGPFLGPFIRGEGRERLAAAYADFLSARGSPRGEFLRLRCLLSGRGEPAEVTPERQARYQELLHLLAPFGLWLEILQWTGPVVNCGRAPGQPPAVRLRQRCPNPWETLPPTARAGVRHCGECRQDVYFCDSIEAAEAHARQGHCLIVPCQVADSILGPLYSRRTPPPDPFVIWAERLFGTGDPQPD